MQRKILGDLNCDFVIVDQEHAPFDTHALDMLALAAHASGIASIVRVADANPSRLLGVLDLGFTGVLVPHVSSVRIAQEVVKACRFVGVIAVFPHPAVQATTAPVRLLST